uniref:RepB n=1 Tax=Aeromonas hydrophila TaxID=644 RepID=A0A6M5ZWY8_AERHY|nr:RepB [Aeromonas hydrophila]
MEEIKAKWVFEQGGFAKAVIAPTPMGAGYHLHLVKFGRNAETEVLERQRGGWRVFRPSMQGLTRRTPSVFAASRWI